jgi:energy-coupling factor transporter ATP-binding protein EcfA2
MKRLNKRNPSTLPVPTIPQKASFPGQPANVPAVYFAGLTIENYKCFSKKLTLDFTKDEQRLNRWIIILGGNGTGKTTVLQTLQGLSGRADAIEDSKAKHLVVSPLMTDPRWFSWHEAGKPGLDNDTLSHKHAFSADLWIGSTYSSPARIKKVNWQVNLSFEPAPGGGMHIKVGSPGMDPSEAGGFICYTYGASRKMALTNRGRQEDPGNTDVLPSAEEWLLELDHAARHESLPSSSISQRYNEVKKILLKILPSVTDIRIKLDRANPTEPKVRIQFKLYERWVYIENLSLGYQTMLGWIVDLARKLYNRYPESKDPLSEPAIVLIDEIDLHLHPRWQRDLMQYLGDRFANTQFIATSHSPLIVQSGVDSRVILLERESDGIGVTASDKLQMVKDWRVDQILTSDLFKLSSAYSSEKEKLSIRRTELLSKGVLSHDDEIEVMRINQELSSSDQVKSDAETILAKFLREKDKKP